MTITSLPQAFSVCQTENLEEIDLKKDFFFLAKTEDEISLVCPTSCLPKNTINCENNFRCFKIDGVLDFSLVGILSKISSLLAQEGISIFAVSTYNTDYILVKENMFDLSQKILKENGYTINL